MAQVSRQPALASRQPGRSPATIRRVPSSLNGLRTSLLAKMLNGLGDVPAPGVDTIGRARVIGDLTLDGPTPVATNALRVIDVARRPPLTLHFPRVKQAHLRPRRRLSVAALPTLGGRRSPLLGLLLTQRLMNLIHPVTMSLVLVPRYPTGMQPQLPQFREVLVLRQRHRLRPQVPTWSL